MENQSGAIDEDLSNVGSMPLRRAFSVLELVATKPGELTASDIADALNLPQASASRLLKRLTEIGLLNGFKRNGRYTTGVRLLRLARSLANKLSIQEIVSPVVQRIADQFGVAAYLAGIFELEVLLLHVSIPSHVDAPFVYPGRQFKAHASAAGKVLLAYQPEDILEEFLTKPLERLTQNTIVEAELFRAHMERTRNQGFAISTGESDPALWGIAFPVQERNGLVLYAVGIIAFQSSNRDDGGAFLALIAAALKEAADELNELIATS